jgi:Ca-activated chloride channel family protein
MTLARALLAAILCCQTLAAQSAPTFRSSVETVYLDATVTGADRRGVIGLTKDDFIIFDEGEPQTVSVFSDKPAPISIAILIDTSRSMSGDRIAAAVRAADAVGRALSVSDQWSLFAFSDSLRRLTPWRQYDARATLALGKLEAEGSTALFESVTKLAGPMREARHRKRALLIVTDGRDNARQGPIEPWADYTKRAVEALRSGEILAYGLGINWRAPRGVPSELDVPALKLLADPTGGAVAVANTDADLDLAAKRLTDELRQQYTLGFVPTKAFDGTYRRISVKTKNPEHRVRTRAGYLATVRK